MRSFFKLLFLSLYLTNECFASQLNFRIRDEPETLDWNRAHTTVETDLLNHLMEGLLRFDSNLKLQAALAERWTQSEAGRSYTFYLRPGVLWSDGVPLRAQDFVYSWQRLLSPLTQAPYASLLFDIEGARDFNSGRVKDTALLAIKALDERRLSVRLNRPYSAWPLVLTFCATFPLREDRIGADEQGWAIPGKMLSLGPFTLQSHDENSQFILKSNPRYYGAKPKLDGLRALVIKDDQLAFKLYENSQIDLLTDLFSVHLAPHSPAFKGRPDLRSFPTLKTVFLGMLPQTYPTSSLRVRRAIAMALDRRKLVQILPFSSQVAQSFVPPKLLGYSKEVGLPFDPVQARIELKLSGLSTEQSLEIDYLSPDWDKSQILGQWIKEELKSKLGIEIHLKSFDNRNYRARLDLQSMPLFEHRWTADIPDPDNFLSIYHSASSLSRSGWKNAEFDKLLELAKYEKSQQKREQFYFKLQKILLEEQVLLLPLYYESNLSLMHTRVKGIAIDALENLDFKHAFISK